jgi:hypothetical protein
VAARTSGPLTASAAAHLTSGRCLLINAGTALSLAGAEFPRRMLTLPGVQIPGRIMAGASRYRIQTPAKLDIAANQRP